MRLCRTINRDWSFRYTAEPVETDDWAAADLPAADWLGIALPHTWSTYETTGHLHPFIRDAAETDDPTWWHGWGWYRKRFTIGECYRGARVFAEFDGVQKIARIYLNGTLLQEHYGGFSSFSVELTNQLRFGEKNVLAIAVSNRRDDRTGVPPMTAGNWNLYGGIYRDVRLVIKQPVHIPYQGNWQHEGGTFITTPEVSSERAIVHARTWLRNTLDQTIQAELLHHVLDPQAREVVSFGGSIEIGADELKPCELTSPVIPKPQLWSPEMPAVYHLLTTVRVDGQVVDELTSSFGFRWFHWDYEARQFYLNGEPVHLHGTNRHQEYPWLGDAIPKWLHEVDLHAIRHGLGHNFLRACHYPQDPLVYELTDRLGLITCVEVPNIKHIRFADDIQRRHVVEMIRRDRNHPSIVMWSMGNETNCAADGDWARAEDPTRIIHFRKCRGRGEDEPHNSDQIDMENLLRCSIRGWLQDEDGPDNGQLAGSEVWQHRQAMVDDGSVRGRIDRNNMVMWIYADHGADREYGGVPLQHINPKGWVDAYREPKLIYHLYRANFAAELMVHVHRRWWRGKYLGQRHRIQVDSNAESVELRVNGKRLAETTPDRFGTCTFDDVTVVPGTLTAIARRGDHQVTDTVHLSGAPARLVLETSHEMLVADRACVALVRVSAIDLQGHPVPHAHPTLHWQVRGPARLIGPPVWQSDIAAREAAEGCMYTVLPVTMPIRATAEPGEIEVRVSAAGLRTGTLTLQSQPVMSQRLPDLQEPPVADGRLVRPPTRPKPTTSRTIPIIYADLEWPHDTRDGYWRRLDSFIRDQGVRVDSMNPAYVSMLDALAELLVTHQGTLIADDYNFAVERFNQR